uniref:Integrase zinc-binding domain-containing protein n=1 Tax=Tanacetum cinerariifolium TaxID=118510 RepID=A0A699HPI9_TANCI|nr:hypothetical protein [Tanacetum cinerariifolium]
MGLELLKHNYSSDPDFGELFSSCQNHATESFFWPKMVRDVEHFVRRCLLCHRTKGHFFPIDYTCHYLYPLPHGKTLVSILSSVYLAHNVKRILLWWWSIVSQKWLISLLAIPQVTNRTLGSLLRALITTNLKQWEDLLPQAEFAYNKAPNKTTGLSPFIVVYGLNPKTPLDLAVLDTSSKFNPEAGDRAVDIKALHQHIHDKITKSNELLKYRRDKRRKHILFQPGDLVWIHFRKDRFPAKRRSKLSSATFNVANIEPYYDPIDPIPSLSANFSDAGDDDRPAPKDPSDMFDPNPPPDPESHGKHMGQLNSIKSFHHLIAGNTPRVFYIPVKKILP